MITDRQFKSAQTKSENIYKKLKEDLKPLYKKRLDLLQDLNYFYAFEDHEQIGKVPIRKLNEVRAKLMYDLALNNAEVERITTEMINNHKKKIDVFLEWQKCKNENSRRNFKI